MREAAVQLQTSIRGLCTAASHVGWLLSSQEAVPASGVGIASAAESNAWRELQQCCMLEPCSHLRANPAAAATYEAKEEDKDVEMRAFQGCCMQPGPRAALEVLSGGINLRKTSLKASVGRQQNSVCHQLYKRSLTK